MPPRNQIFFVLSIRSIGWKSAPLRASTTTYHHHHHHHHHHLNQKRTISSSLVSSIIPVRSFRNKKTHIAYPLETKKKKDEYSDDHPSPQKKLNQKQFDRLPSERARRRLVYQDNLDLAMRQAERYLSRVQFSPGGTYTEYYLIQSLETIDLFRKLRSPLPRAVQLSFRLLDRLTVEVEAAWKDGLYIPNHPRKRMHPLLQHCLGNSQWITPLVKTWAKAIVQQRQNTHSPVTAPQSSNPGEQIHVATTLKNENNYLTLFPKMMQEDETVFTPRELLELLRVMSERLSICGKGTTPTTAIILGAVKETEYGSFTMLDPYVVSLITQIEISFFHAPNQQPAVANELLDWIRTMAKIKRPDPASYNQIAQAYVNAESGTDNVDFTARKMQEIIDRMDNDCVPPNEETFRIFLRFWGRQPPSPDGFALDQMEAILDRMKQRENPVRLDFVGLAQVLVTYANHDCIDPAVDCLHELLRLQKWKVTSHASLMAESVQQLLLAHLRILSQDPDASNEQKEQILRSAFHVFDKVDHGLRVSVFDKDKLEATMLEMYARAGKHEEAWKFVERRSINAIKGNILIPLLSNAGKMERATQILQLLLLDTKCSQVSLESFHSILHAYAQSSEPDALDNAYQIFRILCDDPVCKAAGVQPDVNTYNLIVTCFSNAVNSADGAAKANCVLDKILQASDAKSNERLWFLNIQACVNAGDVEQAKNLLETMRSSPTPPELLTYNEAPPHVEVNGLVSDPTQKNIWELESSAKAKPDVNPATS